jgi:hypothetical protein
MKRNRDAGDTFHTVRDRYEEWEEGAPPPRRSEGIGSVLDNLYISDDVIRTIGTAIGVGTGLLMLALAGLSFYTASQWGDIHRDGAATGYTLVGFFLTVSGLGGVLGTLNHNFRVLNPDRESAVHH